MTALAGYVCNIYLSATSSIAFSNLLLIDSGDHTNFQASNTSGQRYWDPTVALVVQTAPDGVTWTTITNYTALFCGGKITLPSALAGATPSVRVSGNYLPISFLGNAKSIDIKPQIEIQDITSFQNPPVPWKQKLANLGDTDISLDKWWIDGTYIAYLDQRCVIVAYPNVTSIPTPNQRYECFAFLKGDSLKFVNSSAHEETLDFTADGSINYYAQ